MLKEKARAGIPSVKAGAPRQPMHVASHPLPARKLVGLTGAVALLHMVVLQNTPLAVNTHVPLGTRVFSTRTLQINPPAPAATPAPPAPAIKRARKVARLAPKPSTPVPAAALAPVAVSAADIAEPAPVAPEPQAQVAPPTEPASAPAAAPIPRIASVPAITAVSAAAAPVDVASAPAGPPTASLLPEAAGLASRSYAVPGSIRLKFNATGQRGKMNYQALGEMVWQHDGNNYEARMEIGVFLVGARVVSSAGRLTGDGLAPKRFSDKFRSELAAHFDRDKGRVIFSGNTPEAVLLPGAQDQLSVFVQLASMIGAEPQNFPQGATITMQTVGPRTAEPWVFTVDAQENLHLPGGSLETTKLTRNPRKEYDQRVELWLAPALSYLPARIRITFANGDFVDQQWRSTSSP